MTKFPDNFVPYEHTGEEIDQALNSITFKHIDGRGRSVAKLMKKDWKVFRVVVVLLLAIIAGLLVVVISKL